MSLWQVRPGRVEHHIENQLPLVQSVDVHTDYTQRTVTLTVREKSFVAVLLTGKKAYRLLDDGTVYDAVSLSKAQQLPLIETTGNVAVHVGQPTAITGLSSLCKQMLSLTAVERNAISEISLNPYGDVTVFLENGFAVQCASASFGATMKQVPGVIAYFTKAGYGPGLIDMTGQPPYRYSPYQLGATTSNSGTSSNGTSQQGGVK